MNKKIVILALHLGTGGAERVICNVANLLSEKFDVKIISTYRLSETPSFYINPNIEIEYLIDDLKPNRKEIKDSIREHKPINLIKELIKSIKVLYLKKHRMIKKIKSLDCDIVISTRIFHNKLVGKYAKRNIIKIAQEHNDNNNKKYIKRLIKSLKNIDYFMPISKELFSFYKTKLKTPAVVFIPNFIEQMPVKKADLTKKQIISVGRLDKIKRFDDLIDIFNKFQKKHPDWCLHIIGDGPEKEELQNKVNELNLNNKITFCGTMLSDELETEYMNSSVFAMTSDSESFGLVLVEAASYGLPLIAFNSARRCKRNN